MSTDPNVPAPAHQPPLLDAKRLKLVVGVLAVVLVGVVAWMFVRAAKEESSAEKWDLLARIRLDYEPNEDPFQADTSGIFRKQRDAYVEKLDDFLEKHAKGSGDALEPYVRFLIAKTSRDTLVAMRDVTDFAQRKPYHDRAIAELTTIRDGFPEFPANWSNLAPPGKASTIRAFLEDCEKARAYEEQMLPKDRMPKTDTVVLVRTDRGDLRLGVYAEDAPEAVERFLTKAKEGRFDGTAFYEKTDTGTDETPARRTLRAGDPASRDAKPYDKDAATKLGKATADERILPGDSRNRIPFVRGVVAAWRPDGSEYDETAEFLVAVKRSPEMDYNYTPIARALDEASLATIDRIWGTPTWKADKDVASRTDVMGNIENVLQVPARIVKVLVYQGGAVVEGGVTAVPQKVSPDDSEKSLSAVKPDAYLTPIPPAPAKAEEKPADKPADPPADGGGDKPAGS